MHSRALNNKLEEHDLNQVNLKLHSNLEKIPLLYNRFYITVFTISQNLYDSGTMSDDIQWAC